MKMLPAIIPWSAIILLLSLTFSSCTPEPEPIQYGFDACAHCKMTITDARYGAEAVTKKGKIFKFDSIECMAVYLQEENMEEEILYKLVTDFEQPEKLITVEAASILHSEALPSPMGMYLTAFGEQDRAQYFQQERGGQLLNWQETLQICRQ